MYTREITEIFHVGWPDPDWIKGFSVVIRPLLEIDLATVNDVMTAEDIPDVERVIACNNFDSAQLNQESEQSRLLVVRATSHCGTPGSRMHENALNSLNFRLDMLFLDAS